MQEYEYKVIPAPMRGERDRGLKTPEDRFANTLTATLNAMAVDGWDYLRAETLPAEERSGLRGKNTVYHNMLVFRRAKGGAKVTAPAASRENAPAPKAEPVDPVLDPANQGDPAGSAQPLRVPSAVERRARALSAKGPEGNSPKLGAARPQTAG